MHVVVGVVVAQVAEDEPREGGAGVRRPENQGEEAEEERREGDADGRGHDQPHRVVGMVVVDAVDHEVEPVAATELGLPVEEEAMEPVLGQGPDGEPPARTRSAVLPAPTPRSMPEPDPAIDRDEDDAGMAGCTRRKKSRNRLSNIGGEAASRLVARAPSAQMVIPVVWYPPFRKSAYAGVAESAAFGSQGFPPPGR